jgi:type IV pilus assembly protein PilW
LINFQTLQAGAIELKPTADPATIAFSMDYTGFDPEVTELASTVSVHGLNGNGTTTQDTLRISYEDNGLVRDCLGQTTATPARVDNVFTYVPTPTGGGNIFCTGAATGSTAQPILDGVEDFQVLYGIRTVNASIEGFQFYNAAQINGLANIADDSTEISGPVNPWSRVNTINICLQLRGDSRGNPRPGFTAIAPCGAVLDTNDGFLRRVYRRTFSIRNALL